MRYFLLLPVYVYYIWCIDKYSGKITQVSTRTCVCVYVCMYVHVYVCMYVFTLHSVYWTSWCPHADQILPKLLAPHNRLSRPACARYQLSEPVCSVGWSSVHGEGQEWTIARFLSADCGSFVECRCITVRSRAFWKTDVKILADTTLLISGRALLSGRFPGFACLSLC